ncbi:hypothetical protein O4214_30490 [Rhodococcus erythropolis]|uniref:hypothetical protein n=1 Tax=Rhodococcus erythropolis TaxID=1833 RepID=UPI001E36DBDD|nr:MULTISPECIES: hypothetical protein [Rhodococcus erythropolis group]MCD2109392.1 hypothetical protein [Rhodococcus qingshengii]MCZ4528319.1 hypothetical protein [Rhodococcus erythropolis]
MDTWTIYAPYLTLTVTLLACAAMLRDVIHKLTPQSRAITFLAGLGHAIVVVVLLGFTLVAFYDWIAQYRDGVRIGNALLIPIAVVSGSCFAAALIIWGRSIVADFRSRRRDRMEAEQAAVLLQAHMSWYQEQS